MDQQALRTAGVLTTTASGDWLLSVHVQPGARTNEIAGIHGNRLKVRLKAPPVDGKANKALIRWAATYFNVPTARITLIRGKASRQKTLKILEVS